MWPAEPNSMGTYTDNFVRFPTTQCSTNEDFSAYRTPTRADFWRGAYLVSRNPVTKENLAAMLCELVLAEGVKEASVEQIVIIAEHASSPERIYKSVGFSMRSFQVALQWDLK